MKETNLKETSNLNLISYLLFVPVVYSMIFVKLGEIITTYSN